MVKQGQESVTITTFCMLSYIILFIIDAFFPWTVWQYIMTAAAAVVLFSFRRLNRTTAWMAGILFLLGGYLLLTTKAPAVSLPKAAVQTAGIISLLLTVPLLGITLYFRPYREYLLSVVPRYVTSPFRFYAAACLLVNLLSMLLNLAGLSFAHQLLKDIAARFPRQMFYQAMIRGIAPNVMWSPSFISLAIAVQYTGIPWHVIAPMGLAVALAAFAVSIIVGWFEYGRRQATETAAGGLTDQVESGLGVQLTLQMLFLVTLIVLLEYLTGKSALVVVPLVAFTAPYVMSVVLKKPRVFRDKLQEYLCERLPQMYNEFVLFIAIGFFGYALGLSEVRQAIQTFAGQFGDVAPFFKIVMLTAIVSVLSIIGVHPNITIATVAVTLSAGSLGLSPLQLVGGLLAGYALYNLLSPFSGVILVVAGLTGEDPFRLSIKINIPYAVLYALAAAAVLACWF